MQAKALASEVYDSFYELFLYEALEQLIAKHHAKGSPLNEILTDIEHVGQSMGRKAIDLLVRDMPVKF